VCTISTFWYATIAVCVCMCVRVCVTHTVVIHKSYSNVGLARTVYMHLATKP
jgi:hypothetical protein